jgi:hypothetical protein
MDDRVVRRPLLGKPTSELRVAATRIASDGERVVVRTADGWLAQIGDVLVPIATEPGDDVFPIGGGRLVRACGAHAIVIAADGGETAVELGGAIASRDQRPASSTPEGECGAIAYAAAGAGTGWIALVERGDTREIIVIAGDARVVRRIGMPDVAALRSAAERARALVLTRRGHVLVVDLRTGAVGASDAIDADAIDRLDAACDPNARRVVIAARSRAGVIVHQAHAA